MKSLIATTLALVMISGTGIGAVLADEHHGERDQKESYEEPKDDRDKRDRGEQFHRTMDEWYDEHEVPEDVRAELRENFESMRETHRDLREAHRELRRTTREGELQRGEELAAQLGDLVEQAQLHRLEQARLIRDAVGEDAYRDLRERIHNTMRGFRSDGDRKRSKHKDHDDKRGNRDRKDREKEWDGKPDHRDRMDHKEDRDDRRDHGDRD